MPPTIVRSDAPRLFPLPGASWEDAGSPARDILSLSERPLGTRLGCGGGRPGPSVRVGRLLASVRRALTEEADGRWTSADLYWGVVRADMAALRARPDAWPAAGALTGAAAGAAALREIVLDGAIAVLNGHATLDNPVPDRFFALARLTLELAELAGLQGEEGRALGESLIEASVRVAATSGRFDAVAALGRQATAAFGGSARIRDALLDMHLEAGAAAMTRHNGDGVMQASELDARIAMAGDAFAPLEATPIACSRLATLHQVCAIAHANAGRLSSALVHGLRAVILSGGSPDVRKTLDELIDAMEARIKRAKSIEAELKAKPGAQLTEEGRKTLDDARTGFGPFKAFDDSEEAANLRLTRSRAIQRRIWRDVARLPEPPDRLDERAEALSTLIGEVDLDGPAETVAEALAGAAGDNELLRGVDWRHVAIAQAEWRNGTAPTAPAPSGPIVAVAPARAARDDEPLPFVFFGPSGRSLRWLALAAVLAIGLASGLGLWDELARRDRDTAFEALRSAVARDDDTAARQAAEQYFSRPPLGTDRRDEAARLLRQRAIELPGLRVRTAAYEAMQQAQQRGDDRAVMMAAETFLRRPPERIADVRTPEVREAYDRAFVAWLAGLRDGIGQEPHPVIEAYKATISSLSATER